MKLRSVMSRGIHGRRVVIMQLGRTLVGAIIGAILGIAVMAAVYLAFRLDSAWLALPVAVLTGLGVRMMVSTSGHASYLRGAITGLLALGAYLLGWSAMATIAQQTAAKAAQSTRVEQPAEGDKAEGAEAAEAAAPVETPKAPDMPIASKSSGARASKAGVPKGFSTLDYIVLCAAGLIAYELGRGTAGPKQVVVEGEETITEVPAGTHPDA
jgi:hypothetical protein